MTFSGLRSRWVMPAACALPTASASSRAVAMTSAPVGRTPLVISSRSVRPSMNSAAM